MADPIRADLAAQPPAPAPIDIDTLLSPEGPYERGTGEEDGAQLVSGPHGNGSEWWAPLYGCDTLETLLDQLKSRLLPHIRPPVSGIDVPGLDGDYGNVLDLCAAEQVDPRVGVPLLKRARKAWGIGKPPVPTPAPALDAEILKKVNDRFFLYCPLEGYECWETEQERDEAAKKLISEYLREGEWSEEVTLIRAGIVTDTHYVVEVDRVDKVGNLDEDGYDENGVYWSSNDYDFRCNYVLKPLPATQDP